MFNGKRGKRLIVVAAGGATVPCKQNTSVYLICEFFLSKIESRVIITKHRNCEFNGKPVSYKEDSLYLYVPIRYRTYVYGQAKKSMQASS